MEVIIKESQYEKLKLSSIQKLVDLTITDKYDFVCKIIITPPHHYNSQYSVHLYFKDLSETSYNTSNYYRIKTDIMNEVWMIIYNFTNETTSLYQKSC